jgi:Mn-dependent DtxR family transcriptional regulator
MCGCFMKNGDPYKSMVYRIVKTLTKDKLIVVERDGIVLTAKGRKAIPEKT